MTSFEARSVRLSAAVDREFGDGWRLMPRAAGADVDAPAGPDPGRAERDIRAVYVSSAERLAVPDAYDTRSDRRPGAVMGRPRLEVDARWQDAALDALHGPVDARAGDIVRREADGTHWRLGPAEPDDMGRRVFPLSRLPDEVTL
ncbi:hypothetical protein SAMN02745172_02467 [Pseudoxanthobacter soli DSM 19599]|uniref:Uncharacterized protein n=1 Tax=Pseudoxanthobacter soli DSM 19599 TaxID=1123029 RepID=A0A1M7ZLP4_9HYPH|nr:hypothetical protein [Pseudoxanthobacter soli]SHO65820.1 hypothetical protein SAMN02745172_02467 [Pseudoxanthobacter soli DSM 19599]